MVRATRNPMKLARFSAKTLERSAERSTLGTAFQ